MAKRTVGTHPWRRTTAPKWTTSSTRLNDPYRCRPRSKLLARQHRAPRRFLVAGLDGLARKGRVIGRHPSPEVLDQIRSTTQSTGLDPMQARPASSATIIPTLASGFTGHQTGSSSRPSSSPSRSDILSETGRRPSSNGLKAAEAKKTRPRAERSAPGHQGQGRPARASGSSSRCGPRSSGRRPRTSAAPRRTDGTDWTPTHPFQSSEKDRGWANPSLLQAGACSGNTISLLQAEEPTGGSTC